MKTKLIIVVVLLITVNHVFAQNDQDISNSEKIYKALKELVDAGKAPGIIAAISSSEGIIAIGSAVSASGKLTSTWGLLKSQ